MAPLNCKWVAVVVVVAVLAPAARSDFASDRDECANQLLGLATCIQYVEGEAAAPTPDCCSGLKQVTAKSLKCLCMLVKDRNEPQLGIRVNVSLALAMPARCGVAANVSDCPRLLNLPPNSTDAQVFLQFEKELAARAATAASGDNNTSTSSRLRGNAVSGRSSTDVSGSSVIKGCLKLAAGLSLAVSILLHLIVFK